MTARKHTSLCGDWQFWVDAEAVLTPTQLPENTCRQIQVPGPWQAQFADLRSYSGPAWYRYQFEVPAEWLAQSLFIGFGAVDYRAEVWLNGRKAGEHEGGYLPFEIDVTSAARAGKNTLVVRVTDPPELFPEIPHGKQSWYGPLSGIWQPVWLEARPHRYIKSLKITPDGPEASLAVTLSQPLAKTDSLLYQIFTPDGVICAQVETAELNASLTVADPLLWDIDQPHLYTARVTVLAHGETDWLEEQFGFRTIEARDGQLWLNGRSLYLRGALDQDYYPDLICTPPSLEYVEAQFRQAREMGLNCLRVHIKVADPRYYTAADRVGLLIWTELPNWERLTPAAKQRGRETIAGMIERDWNHPSIIIWTIINEAWGTELATNPDHRAWLAEMFDWVKQLDPTRLVVDNSACFPNGHVNSDIDDFHFYAAMPDGTHLWDGWVDAFAHRANWLYGPEPDYQANRKNGAPLLVSEFGNWGLPDIARLRNHYGDDPWWFETGWDWGGGDVYPHAADGRFYDFHLDKVFGEYAGLARASQWAQFEALRYEIETMRLYPQIAGYVITEFTDVHWECNGLLNMVRQPKAHYRRLAEINADTVIVPRVPRRAWRGGETIDISLHLSHYGTQALRGGSLLWSLAGEEFTAVSGAFDNLLVAPAQVVELPPLRLTLPDLLVAARASLQLKLMDGFGNELARNEIVLALFPQTAVSAQTIACTNPKLAATLEAAGHTVISEPALAFPLIVTKFGEANRRFVEQGGRALFLAETPDALQTVVPRLQLNTRQDTAWSGDWASSFAWYRRDLWGKEIPGDGRFDFTFSSVLPKTVISSVRTADFRQEVLAGLFVGWLRRPAGIVQKLPVGDGTLLVSTLRLQENLGSDPLADRLFAELLALL